VTDRLICRGASRLEMQPDSEGPREQLLVADQNRKLRLYKGINLQSEHALVRHARGITANTSRHLA